jgi:tRNA uridine 5-carboxymethylaminomethyl modification enzyme
MAIDFGIVSDLRKEIFNKKCEDIHKAENIVRTLSLTTTKLANLGVSISQDGSHKTAFDLLGLPNFGIDKTIEIFPELVSLNRKLLHYLCIESRYSSYLTRQNADIQLFKEEELELLDDDIDYFKIPSLSTEVREKLHHHKPATIGAARRISGVTPAALIAIIIYMKTRHRN